jgi:hypothetical protein
MRLWPAMVVVFAAVTGAAYAPRLAAAGVDCSQTTAVQLLTEHHLGNFQASQVLCGPFAGPGSHAMAIVETRGTCLPNLGWVLFESSTGTWHLVFDSSTLPFKPPGRALLSLAAVGAQIRETDDVFRASDSPCNPTGGTQVRGWRWDGTTLQGGDWTSLAAPALAGRWAGPVHQTGAATGHFEVVLDIKSPLGTTSDEQLVGICEGALRYAGHSGNTYTYYFSTTASNCSNGYVKLTALSSNTLRYDWDGAGSTSTGILSRATSATGDRGAIMEILREYQTDFAHHDAAGLSAIFAPNIVRYGVVAGGCGTLAGRNAVVANYRFQFPSVATYSLVGLTANQIEVNGSVAQVSTAYQINKGTPESIQFTLAKLTGGWRISAIHAKCPV